MILGISAVIVTALYIFMVILPGGGYLTIPHFGQWTYKPHFSCPVIGLILGESVVAFLSPHFGHWHFVFMVILLLFVALICKQSNLTA
jgi:hypothetical protein